MYITQKQSQACFDAWINCEELLVKLTSYKSRVSRKLSKVIDECALICMGTFHAMKCSSTNLTKIAMLCVGICEECAEICESCDQKEFKECAAICRRCSELISPLIVSNP